MLKLFRLRGFTPFVAVMILNAFVDLGHKIIIQNTIFKIYQGDTQVVLTAIVNGLILLPFVMLFTPAGFFSDHFSKTRVMQISAMIAVLVTAAITVCYYLGWFMAAFAMTFVLAAQSAIYSPAKYGLIKELVGKKRLGAANGLVQAVTIISILAGIFGFSIFFELSLAGQSFTTEADILRLIAPAGFILVGLSLLELFAAYRVPELPAADAQRSFDWRRYLTGQSLRQNLKSVTGHRGIWLAVVGLSTFWGLSQAVLAVFPAFAKAVTGETNTVLVQGAMAGAGIGIMAGSVIAGRLSRDFIETGLIPIGALGIVISLAVLPLLGSIVAFALMFFLLGLFGGLFIIPLNALLQFHAGSQKLGTVLAGNNFIQNVVMLLFLAVTGFVSLGGVSQYGVLWLLAGLAVLGTGYVVWRLPQSLIRFVRPRWFFGRVDFEVEGYDNLPETGPVVALCQCCGSEDWAALQVVSPRAIRFFEWGEGRLCKTSAKGVWFPALMCRGDTAVSKTMKQVLEEGGFVALILRSGLAGDETILPAFFKSLEKLSDLTVLPVRITSLAGENRLQISFGPRQPLSQFSKAVET